MSTSKPEVGTLIFFCGKMGAGKSTEAMQVAQQHQAVLLSEDQWLSLLFPQQINNFDDYLVCAKRLKPLVKQHVQQTLQNGINVVMDFPANTVSQRQWFKALSTEMGAPHQLIFMDASDEVCLQHLGLRREQQPERAAFDNEAMFHHVSSFFEAPKMAEDLNLIIKRPS